MDRTIDRTETTPRQPRGVLLFRVAEPAVALVARTACRRPGHTVFASSRSLNFWILPVDVFGISVNTTSRGHL